jgi:hypothetical protein
MKILLPIIDVSIVHVDMSVYLKIMTLTDSNLVRQYCNGFSVYFFRVSIAKLTCIYMCCSLIRIVSISMLNIFDGNESNTQFIVEENDILKINAQHTHDQLLLYTSRCLSLFNENIGDMLKKNRNRSRHEFDCYHWSDRV